jgi:hypothetical protein
MKKRLEDTKMSRRKFLKACGAVGGAGVLGSFLGYDFLKPQRAWAVTYTPNLQLLLPETSTGLVTPMYDNLTKIDTAYYGIPMQAVYGGGPFGASNGLLSVTAYQSSGVYQIDPNAALDGNGFPTNNELSDVVNAMINAHPQGVSIYIPKGNYWIGPDKEIQLRSCVRIVADPQARIMKKGSPSSSVKGMISNRGATGTTGYFIREVEIRGGIWDSRQDYSGNLDATGTSAFGRPVVNLAHTQNVIVSDCRFVNNHSDSTIQLVGCQYVTIRQNHFEGFKPIPSGSPNIALNSASACIRAEACKSGVILPAGSADGTICKDISVTGNSAVASGALLPHLCFFRKSLYESASPSWSIRILNNLVAGAEGHAVDITNAHHVIVANNQIRSKGNGIAVREHASSYEASKSIVINANLISVLSQNIEAIHVPGVSGKRPSLVSITDNTISDGITGAKGVYVQYADDLVVSGNTIRKVVTHSIQIFACTKCLVVGNGISQGMHGILVTSSSFANVQKNTLTQCTGTPVKIDTSTQVIVSENSIGNHTPSGTQYGIHVAGTSSQIVLASNQLMQSTVFTNAIRTESTSSHVNAWGNMSFGAGALSLNASNSIATDGNKSV